MTIVKHNYLEPHLFNRNEKLKTPVRDMLLKIANCYIDYIRDHKGYEIQSEDIKDIFIYGSSTNYFYNKKSDIDMCIVFDLSKMTNNNPNINVPQNLKMLYYDWECLYHCIIYGRKIDISFEDVNKRKNCSENEDRRWRTGAAYSLINNDWIYKPVYVSNAEFRQIKREARKIYNQIMHDYKRVKRNGFQLDEIQELYKNIYESKNASQVMNVAQPITPMYIAFRWIRNKGIIKKLRVEAVKKTSEPYVLK